MAQPHGKVQTIMKKVAIIMGSKSDADVVKKAVDRLNEWGVTYKTRVLSAHRTPDEVAEFARGAQSEEYGVIIAAAGKAAALPGCVAAYTTLPVIGLPIQSSFMDGLDSLLSIAQMPPGIPVATVGTNAAENAAILAVQILGVADSDAREIIVQHKQSMRERILEDDKNFSF